VFLAIKGGEQKLACKVVDTANGTKIACPHDAATEGAEVTFAGVDTSAPVKDAKDIEMGEEGSAAAGSAAAPAPAPPPAPPHPVRPAHVVPAHPAPADNGSAAAPPPPPADQPAGSAAP
jgi:hypothetical protein